MRDQELGKKGGKIRKQCRLCGTYSVYAVNILHCFIKLRNIESNNAFESNSVPLVQLINDCLDINVVESTNLPIHSCRKCYNHLISWHSFKSNCLKQQLRFKENHFDANFDENGITSPSEASIGKPVDVNDKNTNYNETVRTEQIEKNINNDFSTNDLKNKCVTEDTVEENFSGLKELVNVSKVNNESSLKLNKKVGVNKHKKKHKKVNDNNFQCDKCSKTFHSKFAIRKHVKTHSEQREHCCHICGMLFKTASYLQYHVHLHSGRKRFSCPYCSKQFYQTNHLKQHIRIHTGERPYECSECEQKFTRSSQLQHHVKTVHRKEQRFKCDLCGKGFMYSNNFKAHMMRHEGQRNAKCNLCDKTFVTNNALFRHQRRHTGDKPFACQECGKRFADCSNRKKHMLTYHCGVKLNDTLVKKSDEIIRKEHKVIATTEDVPQNISEGQINKQNNTVTLIKSVIEPSIVLLTTLNMKNNEIIETKTLENFVNNSDISYKSSDVYVDLSNVQVISQSDGISTVDQTQLSLMPANGSLQDQELLKISNIYVNNTTSGLDVTDQFQVPESVQDNERLDIPFPDDLPIFSSLSDTLPQNMAYFIPDKELFNHADGLTQNNIQAENVTFNQIDIESNYLDLVDNQQKTTPDILNAIVPCEAQSVMKMLSSEGTVLLFPEQDDFSKITEL